jgi:hypothetical protein
MLHTNVPSPLVVLTRALALGFVVSFAAFLWFAHVTLLSLIATLRSGG